MNDDEQLELDIPEEPQTEEGLEEVIKRNEKRRQEEYDEATKGNEELRRRQTRRGRGGETQLDIPGLFEARSGLRTTAALGTEIFLNTLVDPFFEPGTQVAAGTAINFLAQRIRGGELSKGELAAAGLASLIPGGAQGRAITQFAKGSAKGALSGAIETAGMAGIDEGRLPTTQELAAGLGIGAAFGGVLSTPQALKVLGKLSNRIKGKKEKFVRLTPEEALELGLGQPMMSVLDDGDEFGTYLSDTEVFKTIQQWRRYRPSQQEVNEVRSTLLKFGMVNNRFDFNIFKAGTKRDKKTGIKRFTANEERALISLFVTAPITKVNYNQVSKRVMPQFRKQYGPMLKALDIPPSELQLHHLLPLKASLPLYHGLVYDSDEWWELTAFLLKRHIKAGDSEANLRKLIGAGKRSVPGPNATIANPTRPLKTPHSISHQHVRDEFAEDGSKFFTQEVLDSIFDNQARRLEVADAYTRKMRRNFDLTNQAQIIYETTFDPKDKFTMEDVVRTMTRLDNDGYLDGDRTYQVDIINDMIQGIKREGGGNEYMKYLDLQTEQDFIATQNRLRQERLARNQDIDDFNKELQAMIARDKTVGFSRVSNLNDATVEAERILEPLFKQPDGTFRSYTVTARDGSKGTLTYEFVRNLVAEFIFRNL
tara:strand:+ start:40 stop:1995 length:1956 start_codon:yes stop_codon:yes gene_type:complete